VSVCCRSAAVDGNVSESESETERTRDLHERDEFASRLKRKDKDRTRRVMSKSEQKVHYWFLGDHLYKSSAVAAMGDRLATTDMGRKLGAVPLFGGWIPI